METTAGSSSSWGFLIGLAALVAFPPVACNGSPSNDDPVVSATITDQLAGVGPSVVVPALTDFRDEIASLQVTLLAWQDALESGSTGDAHTAAQVQWVETMAAWQVLEVMQIGPSGSSLTAIAGEDLRDEIYSWPTINPCRIDQETVYGTWDDGAYFTENLVNSYGLDALAHTLFSGLDNTCPGQVDINTDGSWDALGDAGMLSSRADFSVSLAEHLLGQAEDLLTIWSPEGEDFSGQLALTAATSPYASEQEALNAVYDALFYLETLTKDRKLATPLGIIDCPDALCPEDVEGLTSGSGASAIAANLSGFRALFTGNDGIGFDDLLADLGHGDLSDQILSDLDTAQALAETIEGPLDIAITDDTEAVTDLYEAVKTVTDALKGDLATVLALSIPSEAAGDND